MVELMKGCVGSFDQCVVPIVPPEERAVCGLTNETNAEYGGWQGACIPRGEPRSPRRRAPA